MYSPDILASLPQHRCRPARPVFLVALGQVLLLVVQPALASPEPSAPSVELQLVRPVADSGLPVQIAPAPGGSGVAARPATALPGAAAPGAAAPSATALGEAQTGVALMADGEVVRGFGRRVPLELAVHALVPQGREVRFAPGVDRSMLVDWQGGAPWPATLAEAVRPIGATIRLVGRDVVIEPASATNAVASVQLAAVPPAAPAAATSQAPAPAVPASAPAPAAGAEAGTQPKPAKPEPPARDEARNLPIALTQTNRREAAVLPTQTDAVKANGAWRVLPNTTLRQTLSQWASLAGWGVIYRTDRDYPIMATAEFSGDFLVAAAQLVRAFRNVRPAPVATFYKGNHQIVLTVDEEEVD